jgi:TRAP-type uncharacterized transport system substrate-binding protein
LLLLALTLGVLGYRMRPQKFALSMTAGDALGHRHELAVLLHEEAEKHGLRLNVRPTTGSLKAVELVAAGELDTALVQGGLDLRKERVCEVAVLLSEPLHLFVKSELIAQGLPGLKKWNSSRWNSNAPTNSMPSTCNGCADG